MKLLCYTHVLSRCLLSNPRGTCCSTNPFGACALLLRALNPTKQTCLTKRTTKGSQHSIASPTAANPPSKKATNPPPSEYPDQNQKKGTITRCTSIYQTCVQAEERTNTPAKSAYHTRVRTLTVKVGAYLLVNGVDQLRQGGQRRAHVFEAGLGLAPAKVGQCPGGVAQHRELRPVRELLQEGAHRTLMEDEVAAHRRVAGDVAQRPDLSQNKRRVQSREDG